MEQSTPRSCSNQRNQISLAVAAASALYSASVLERATTVCFLLLQEIRESPRRKQYPVVDRQSVGSLDQSALNMSEELMKNEKKNEDYQIWCLSDIEES